MKFLADMGVSQGTVLDLRERGHEVISLQVEMLWGHPTYFTPSGIK